MSRRFVTFGAQQIEARARSHPEEIPELIEELGFRRSKGAKHLLSKLKALDGKPLPKPLEQRELFDGAEPEADEQNMLTERPRTRPLDWAHLFPFPATSEQEIAVDIFIARKNMKVSAFAGTGKTSTLRFLSATANKERGLYLAFNRAISKEAKSVFNPKTDCRTTHSAALQQIRGQYAFSNKKLYADIGPKQLASVFELELYDAGVMSLEPDMMAHLILSTVRRFCQSGDDRISAKHAHLAGRALGLSDESKADLQELILHYAEQLWDEKSSEKSEMPLGHDGYLKLWSLSKPKLAYSFILLDEAQDTNPAVLSVLKAQSTQVIYVGDKHQQIYEWRGAENAMETIDAAEDAFLTTSFRFGPPLAAVATKILHALGETKRLEGNPNVETEILSEGAARAILTRTNAMLFREIVDALDNDRKPHIVGGTEEMKALLHDVDKLQKGVPGSLPEFFGFTNWRQVVEYAQRPEGESLNQFVNLVEQMGRGALWRAVLSVEPDESKADVAISTAHKAKGREWESVRLSEDFSSAENDSGKIPYSEARLFYVALTRAKNRLVVDPVLLDAFSSKLSPDAKNTKTKRTARPSERMPIDVSDNIEPVRPERPNDLTRESELRPAKTAQSQKPTAPQPKKKKFLGLF